METQNERLRITYLARIHVRPTVKQALQALAKEEKVSVAYMIGTAITEYVTARSSQ